jgi:hypothetical protein
MWINGIKKRSEVRSAFDLDTGPDDDVFYVEPGQAAPEAGQPSIPGPLGQQTGATLRGPHLPIVAPQTTEKALGMPEPTTGELDALDRWFAEVAPPDAQGILDAKPV